MSDLVRIKVGGGDLTGVVHRVHFERNVSRPLPRVYATPDRLRQIALFQRVEAAQIVCAECCEPETAHAAGCPNAPTVPAPEPAQAAPVVQQEPPRVVQVPPPRPQQQRGRGR